MDVIKGLGLDIYHFDKQECVLADDLRDLIEKLPVIHGSEAFNGHLTWNPEKQTFSTNKARLICVEKLVKEPVRVEKNFLKENPDNYFKSIEVPKELNGKPFKVVFEEVIE